MSPFPKQNEQARDLEFPGYYPHDQSDHKRVMCGTCHMTDQRAYTAIPVGDTGAPHIPASGTFKTSPSGHAACFECHWKKDKPTADNCAGCHLPPDEIAKEPRNQLSVNAGRWFKDWPREWPKRFSLKFNHDSKEHKAADCTDCHTNTKEMNTLDIPKAEVKIAACVTCHFKSAPNIGKEMFDEDTEDTAEGRNNSSSSKMGKHTCTGCHTNVIGSTPPPCNHFLVGDKYLSLEDYSENAGRIAERCKKNEQ
ncbi:MAG: cytochrome c3 family protein [Pyrinomonadaceae bacterium]